MLTTNPQNVATIRAELGDVSRFSRVDQIIAYAGQEPRTQERGCTAGQKRLFKRGPDKATQMYLPVSAVTR